MKSRVVVVLGDVEVADVAGKVVVTDAVGIEATLARELIAE
jgi:hypothetical protein